MKNLTEIDCNETLWDEITSDLRNGWSGLENELRFVFQTKSKHISEDDIDSVFWDKYPQSDQIEVNQVYPESNEPQMRYFGASIIIYKSEI